MIAQQATEVMARRKAVEEDRLRMAKEVRVRIAMRTLLKFHFILLGVRSFLLAKFCRIKNEDNRFKKIWSTILGYAIRLWMGQDISKTRS